MDPLPAKIKAPFLTAVLLGSVAAEFLVLYFGRSPGTRAALGLLILMAVIWSSARLSIAERVRRTLAARQYERRFGRFRAQVDAMLAEVRRLNWLAVDERRGVRHQGVVEQEMAAAETRLTEILWSLGESAGVVTRAARRTSRT